MSRRYSIWCALLGYARKLIFQLVQNPLLLDHCLGSRQCWSSWKPRCPTNLTSGIWQYSTSQHRWGNHSCTISNIISSVWLCTKQTGWAGSRNKRKRDWNTETGKHANEQTEKASGKTRRTAPTFPTNECDIQVNDIEADDTPTLNASLQKYLPISAASRLAGSPRLGFEKVTQQLAEHPSFKPKFFWELHDCAKESLLACWAIQRQACGCKLPGFADLQPSARPFSSATSEKGILRVQACLCILCIQWMTSWVFAILACFYFLALLYLGMTLVVFSNLQQCDIHWPSKIENWDCSRTKTSLGSFVASSHAWHSTRNAHKKSPKHKKRIEHDRSCILGIAEPCRASSLRLTA